MGIGTRAHRIITIIPISIVTIKIMHAISILYSSLCSLNAAIRTMALTSAIIPIPFHNHESSCINCIGSLPFWNLGSPPRVWGNVEKYWKSQGSPPRVWGKGRAGNDFSSGHPHVCGEKHMSHRVMVSTLGSPPRVWGKDLKISEKHCIILKYTVVRIRHLHL